MKTTTLSVITLAIFLIANLVIGMYHARKIKNISDYCLGRSSWSVGALVMTYVATIIGRGYVLSIQRETFNTGGVVLIGHLGFVMFNLVVAFVFAPKMAKFKGCLALGDMLRQLYGKYAQMLLGLVSPIHGVVICGGQLAAISVILNKILGVEGSSAIVVSGIILVGYTAMGGIRSVAATDVFQFIMLVLVISTITSLAVYEIGGADILFSKIPKPSLEIFSNDNLAPYISAFIVTGVFQSLINEPARVQRILMAGGSTSKIRKVFTYSAFIDLSFILAAMLMAFACIVLYPSTSANEVVLTLLDNLCPNILKPLLCVGLISVLMSTADSFLHSASVSFARDFIVNVLPNSKKEINQVMLARVSTAFIGLISIYFGLWKGSIISLSYMLGIMAPTITVPLVFGILGLKSSNRAFWLAAIFGGLTSLLGVAYELNGLIDAFLIPISMLVNCVIFLTVSYYDNGGLTFLSDPLEHEGSKFSVNEGVKNLLLKARQTVNRLIFPSATIGLVPNRDTTYELFGTCYCIALLTPYFLFTNIPLEYRDTILVIKSIAIAMCTFLIARSRLPNAIAKYLPLLWYVILAYCLPFMSTTLLLITNGGTEYLINIGITIMLMILLVDWLAAVLIGTTGVVASIIIYENFIKLGSLSHGFSFNTIYLLIYQIIFGTIIGLLFARRKQQKVESIEEGRQFATQQYDMAKKRLYTKELSTASSIREVMGDASMDIMKKLQYVDKAIKQIGNAEKLDEVDIWEADARLDELQQSILNLILQSRKFLKLHVENLELKSLATELAKLFKKEFEGTTTINLRAKSTNIKCDKEALFRILTKAIHELKEEISIAGNSPSDTNLTLDITDTVIKYIMSSRENYEKNLPAIRFALSSTDTIDPSLLAEVYEKEIEDPFELKDYSGTAENITVNNYIKAHYALATTKSLDSGSLKIFAFPIDVYEIRPEGFDVAYGPDQPTFRYDPKALGLELFFAGEVRTMTKKTNPKKIQKALDFIRKYHFNQTYRTGEPFYVHSIEATRVLLRLMKYQLDITQSRDAKEIEKNIFTGSRIKSTYLELLANQEVLIITSLLQHLIDRTAVSDSLVETAFGYEVAILLNSLSKLYRAGVIHQVSREEHIKAVTSSYNPTLLCIKLADRMHDLYTIDYVEDVEERKKFAEETAKYFIEAANFLGFHTIARDLEGACNYILTHGKLKGFEFRSEAVICLL